MVVKRFREARVQSAAFKKLIPLRLQVPSAPQHLLTQYAVQGVGERSIAPVESLRRILGRSFWLAGLRTQRSEIILRFCDLFIVTPTSTISLEEIA